MTERIYNQDQAVGDILKIAPHMRNEDAFNFSVGISHHLENVSKKRAHELIHHFLPDTSSPILCDYVSVWDSGAVLTCKGEYLPNTKEAFSFEMLDVGNIGSCTLEYVDLPNGVRLEISDDEYIEDSRVEFIRANNA